MEADRTPPRLTRGITRLHLVGLLINTIVGAGILGVPSKTYALVGAYSVLTWLLCATAVLGIALCLAEVSTRFRESGGPYLYALTAFGPRIAFATGWLRLFTSVLAYATVCNLLVGYLALPLPAVAGGPGRIATITAITFALGAVLVHGLRGTLWMSTAISIGKILLLVLFVVVAAFCFDPARVHWTPLPRVTDLAAACLLSVFAFFGFEAGAIAGGELADPEGDQPIAIVASVGATTLLYVLIQLACIGTLATLGASARPVADAATAMLGEAGGRVVSVGAVVLLLGVLLTQLIGASRILFAMGEQGQMPGPVARVHPRRRTPAVAIVVVALLAWVATLASSFTTAITIAVGTRVLSYIIVCAALPVLRRRTDLAPAAFHLPGGTAIAVLSILACVALLSAAHALELVELAIVVAAGAIAQRALRPGPAPDGRAPDAPAVDAR